MNKITRAWIVGVLLISAAIAQSTGGLTNSCPYSGTNAQTGTSYTVAGTDNGALITFNNAAAVAVTLPVATTFIRNFCFYVQNKGAGAVTITPTTSTINDSATLVLQQSKGTTIFSDATNYQIVSGVGSTVPAGTTNVLPTVVSTASSSAGSVTSLAISPPASIVNGNTLWIFIAAKGAASETWTPASGWTQVGSTLSSVITSQVVTAKFCKVAASESGNYTFSWNNATSGGVQAVATQISGTTCTPDNSGSSTGKASTLTVSPFTLTNTQDLLLITNGQANNTTLFINAPANTTQLNTSSANGIGVFTVPWGNGSTPTVTSVNYAGGAFSDDTTLEVTALAPTVTSSTIPYAGNSSTQALTTAAVSSTGGGTFGGAVSAPTFIIPCDSGTSGTRTINTIAARKSDGTIVSLLSSECSNGSELIDPGGQATNINFGNAGNTGGANLLINSGFVDFISRDSAAGSQDLNVLSLSLAVAGDSLNATSNNFILGCLIDPCTGGTILGDIITRAQTTKFVRIASGVQDELWVNGSGFVGAVPIVAAGTVGTPTVTPTCPNGTCASTYSYGVDCLDSNGGTTAISANGTTAVNAATLDATHFNTITWSKLGGCKTYEIRRTVTATSPATLGLIGTVNSGLPLTFKDNNVAGDASTAPTINGTGYATARGFESTGTQAVLTGTGACGTITTQTGGSTVGQATCTGTTGASTFIITPGITALHGWVCSAQDQTTVADSPKQTSNNTTSCTLTAAALLQNDVLVFTAFAF